MTQSPDDLAALRRWRLILGRYARDQLDGEGLGYGSDDWKLEKTLDYLYDREYEQRGLVGGPRSAGLDGTNLRALDWLQRVKKLFPREVFERVQSQAIDRYGMTELLRDPKTLSELQPDMALAKALLSIRGRLSGEMQAAVREVIRKVVDDILQRLRQEFVNALQGRRNRFRRSMLASAQNFDWRATVRGNLKHYDRDSRRLVIERPRFNARVKRNLPWDVVLCVDQSGSMTDSVMYSAVVAGILSSLPAVRVRLVVFDVSVVDLSHLAHDPVEVLLTVQLGGGTDIGRAMRYCETLVQNPHRTIVALISDFMEGGSPTALYRSVQRMAEARVKLLGLAALNDDAQPEYDRDTAQRLANYGMDVAALTPHRFAEWLAEVMN